MIHPSLFRGLSKLWLAYASAFFFSSPFFLIPFFFPAWHKGTRVASLSWRPSKFICLSLMTISYCHNTKLPTIDRECLFNHDSSSSSLSPSVWLRLAFMRALLLVCRWPSSCGFTALGPHSRGGGLPHCVKSFCPWGSQQWAMERWLSPVSVLALTDGYPSPLLL